jgi:DNA segregation ATPase FtsK/SpoIIIE-like protein
LTLTQPAAVTMLIRLGQIARAAKVNIIAATQRPGVDVVPGTLKTNFDVRVAMALPAEVDSRVILDKSGAEALTPPGQAIYRCGVKTLTLTTPLLEEADRNRRLRDVLGASRTVPSQAVPLESVPTQHVPSQSELIEQTIREILADGERVSVRHVYDRLRGRVSKHAVIEHLRTWRAG